MKLTTEYIKERIDTLDPEHRYLTSVVNEQDEGDDDVKEVCDTIRETLTSRYTLKDDDPKMLAALDFFILETLITYYGQLFHGWNQRLVNGYNRKLVKYAGILASLAKKYEEIWNKIKDVPFTPDSDADNPSDDTDLSLISSDSDSSDDSDGEDLEESDEPVGVEEEIKDLTAGQAMGRIVELLTEEHNRYKKEKGMNDAVKHIENYLAITQELKTLADQEKSKAFFKLVATKEYSSENLLKCFLKVSSNRDFQKKVTSKRDTADCCYRWACYLLR